MSAGVNEVHAWFEDVLEDLVFAGIFPVWIAQIDCPGELVANQGSSNGAEGSGNRKPNDAGSPGCNKTCSGAVFSGITPL